MANSASRTGHPWWSATRCKFQPRIVSVADKKGGAMTLVGIETKVTNQNGIHVADVSRTVVVLNPKTA